MSKLEDLYEMSNEDLCLLYQETNDDDIIEILIKKNSGIINRFLKKWFGRDISNHERYQYLRQCANIAVWKVAKILDPNKGKFTTYLYYVIQKYTRKFMYEFADITVPYYIMRDRDRREKLYKSNLFNLISLDDIIYNKTDHNEIRYEDTIIDDDVDLFSVVARDDRHNNIMKILNKLKPKEQFVIINRFGLDDGTSKTLQEVADLCNVTRERIRQIEQRAIEKLRKILEKSDKNEI